MLRLFVESSRVEALRALTGAAAAAGAEVRVVPDLGSLAATTAPQGVVAHCRPLPILGLDEVAAARAPAALVVLDHLEDPRNVGAIARSALAAGMSGLVLARRRAAPLGATAFKAAAGALERLPVALVSSVAQAVADLGRLGVWTVGLDADGDRSVFGLELLAEPVAIVVGAEGRGLAPPGGRPGGCAGLDPPGRRGGEPQRRGGGVARLLRGVAGAGGCSNSRGGAAAGAPAGARR